MPSGIGGEEAMSRSEGTQAMNRCPICEAMLVGQQAAAAVCPACALRIGLEEDPSALPSEWVPNRVVGNWRLESMIGRGGSSEVYRARQIDTNTVVVIKALSARWALDETARYRFNFEANHKLDHPCIAPVLAHGAFAGRPYLVMPHFGGGGLDQWVEKVWGRKEATVLAQLPDPGQTGFYQKAGRFMADIARAVAFAHQRGLIHRDLKPSNILLDVEGHPYVSDFGSARSVKMLDRLSTTGNFCGSPEYLAPEIAAGTVPDATQKSDIYGIGAILFEVLTGTPPHSGPNVMATLKQVANGPTPSLKESNAQVPSELVWICQTCLSRDPAQRYNSALEVAEDLERFVRDEPVMARPCATWQRIGLWIDRNRKVAATATAAVLLIAIVIARK